MAKAATTVQQSNMPLNGRWVWRDETNTIEYISTNPAGDRGDRRKDRRQKAICFQDNSVKRTADIRGATPSVASRAHGIRLRQSMTGRRTPNKQLANKQQTEREYIALEDVKAVALNMLSEVDVIPDTFVGLLYKKEFDEFLYWILNYFHCFFEKRKHEEKPNPMNIEPSLKDIQYYSDLCAKLESAQKKVGQAYCVLVLGVGLEDEHHMACGMSRVSSTYKDRSMYETLYSYCTFVVWITFRRKEFDMVKQELGRMLRSNTFNPAIRVKNAPPEPSEEDTKDQDDDNVEDKKEKQLTPAEYRRLHGKRPAIKSIINQRSPALVSILPSPKDEASWLFHKTGTHISSREDVDEEVEELETDFREWKIGIISEPFKEYNRLTLTRLGAENEEENEDPDKASNSRKGSIAKGSTPHAKTPQTQHTERGLSREQTAISTVTVDAPSDED